MKKPASIVVYTNTADPVARILSRDRTAVCIHVNELVPHLQLDTWPKPIRTNYPRELIDLFRGAQIFNRTFTFDHTEVAARLAEWKLHTLWATLAIEELVKLGTYRWHDLSIRGVSRSLLPLNAQWFLLTNSISGIMYPRFAYGFGRNDPELNGFLRPQQKSVWSLFDWDKERNLDEFDRHWHKFYVDRPEGTPVICYYVGKSIGFVYPRGAPVLGERLIEAYRALAEVVSKVFVSGMGEFLTFLQDDGTVIFCAFSPHMAMAASDERFEPMLLGHLGREEV